MTEDPRCCGSGMCIIDGEGRCWCGQQWDGQKMCTPPLVQPAALATGAASAASSTTPKAAGEGLADAGRRLLALVAVAWPLAALLPAPAQAQPQASTPSQAAGRAVAAPGFGAAEVRSMQAVVQAQLKALSAGDAAQAFGHASPALQQQFGDAARFIAMVRQSYPMIIGARGLAFRVPEREGAAALLSLQLRDEAGRAWLATYRMEPQPTGGWRIGGCRVTADESRLSA